MPERVFFMKEVKDRTITMNRAIGDGDLSTPGNAGASF